MSVLPVHTHLGQLEIVEIYEYRDRPLLFSCRSRSNTLYLVLLDKETDSADRWFYTRMSRARFEQVRVGEMSLADAFKQAEDAFVFVVTTFKGDTPPIVDTLACEALTADRLPEPDEFLTLSAETFPEGVR